jgi:hypothetical protein
VIIVHIRLTHAEVTPAKSGTNRPQRPRPEAAPSDPDHASHSGWDALVALVRLLARRAAQQHMLQGD